MKALLVASAAIITTLVSACDSDVPPRTPAPDAVQFLMKDEATKRGIPPIQGATAMEAARNEVELAVKVGDKCSGTLTHANATDVYFLSVYNSANEKIYYGNNPYLSSVRDEPNVAKACFNPPQ